ncbi:MAG TPA: alpha-E domain-containing protein [Candidatus Dormibacteraeota bacterium]|nr:alpha-E domain-containing protein [Candidatus Dormibacteraeota bacterium]
MLSSAATSLSLFGRQLERADFLARVLRIHLELSLDRSDEPGAAFWTGLMRLAGWVGSDVEHREQAVELLVAASAGPSVRSSVAGARQAAQAVRPSLPSELYEQVNSLYWRVEEPGWERDVYGLLSGVELGVHLIEGLTENTMFHDEAREFVRLGKYLERMQNTVTVVTRKTAELGAEGGDPLEWTAALKSNFAFESYRLRFSAEVTGRQVVGFLLFDSDLPRSARFCLGEALDSVRRIDHRRRQSRPEKVLARIAGLFDDSSPESVARDPDEFQAEFRRLTAELTLALRATYFQPSQVTATLPGDPTARVPQQQQ